MKRKILNLTQHPATHEQVVEGVVEPSPKLKGEIRELLTFNSLPTMKEIEKRAEALDDIAFHWGAKYVLIGGAPYLMSSLEDELLSDDIIPVYAFSKRESVETVMPDGTVVKKNVFKHLGFIEVRK